MTTPVTPLLSVQNLCLYFPKRSGIFLRARSVLKAVDDVSFDIHHGETLGLVGESGCGKSTVAKAILNLHRPTAGTVRFRDTDLATLSNSEMRPLRRNLQIIFQDPFESLNGRHSVGTILEEPLIVHRAGNTAQRRAKVAELLDLVGLSDTAAGKYPHEFSGGQRQRIGIARAMALNPELLICDEAVSALDVSIQAQILNLLLEIQRERNLAMLFISHDLAVVNHVSDRIAVMHAGQLVETGDAETLFSAPQHPYTQRLLASVPGQQPPD